LGNGNGGMHKFLDNDTQEGYEARFWNCQGKHIAIVAVVTKGIDWAAYIGTDAPNSWDEKDTLNYTMKHGEKLQPEDAKYFFPDIELPYRW